VPIWLIDVTNILFVALLLFGWSWFNRYMGRLDERRMWTSGKPVQVGDAVYLVAGGPRTQYEQHVHGPDGRCTPLCHGYLVVAHRHKNGRMCNEDCPAWTSRPNQER